MFFGRFGQKPSVESLSRTAKNKHRRRLAVVSIAAAVTLPVGVVEIAHLYAQDVQPLSNQQLLKQGQTQLSNDEYEEALATLKQVHRDSLSSADQTALDAALTKAGQGAQQRQDAREDYEAGEKALAAGDASVALTHYRAAASNTYADPGTHQKALEKIALAQSEEKKAEAKDPQTYKEAVADYKAGKLESAQAKFEELKSHGYHAPLFQRSPQDYLSDIQKKVATAAPPAPPAAPVAPAPAAVAATPPSAPKVAEPSAKDLYHRGRHEYRTGDWIAARRDLTAAEDHGFHPGLFEESPNSILAKMNKKEAADRQREMTQAERNRLHEEQTAAAPATAPTEEAAETPTPATPAPEVAETPAPTTAPSEEAAAIPAPSSPAPAPSEATPATPAAPTPAVAESSPAPATTPTEEATATPATPVVPPTETETAQATPPPVVQPTTQAAPTPPTAQEALTNTAKLEQIRAQERSYEASQLVDQAREAQNEGRTADALSLYTRAADLDPKNQAAIAGRAQLQVLTGRTPTPSSLMQRQGQIINERRQSIQYAFNSAIQNANDAIAAHKFAVAETALANARAARDQDPTIFSPEEIRAFNSTITSTEQTLIRTRDQTAIEERTRAQQEAEAQQRRQIQEAAISRQNTISDLIKASRRAVDEGKYDEAINILNQILTLDPNNDYALGVKPLVQDKLVILQQRKYREEFSQHLLGQLNNAEEEKIPYDDIFRYPDNWPDISAKRDQEVAESQGIDAQDRAVNQILDRQIPEVHFDGIPFSDVVSFFRN
ncbi:MAG TPA: hypothetical protein VG722_10360, partial [Tepidisphaeraceae bacterium]|nr:hypothetical protein [Tepidisphaeraceae bacterium]